jgi:hypothetical protein
LRTNCNKISFANETVAQQLASHIAHYLRQIGGIIMVKTSEESESLIGILATFLNMPTVMISQSLSIKKHCPAEFASIQHPNMLEMFHCLHHDSSVFLHLSK